MPFHVILLANAKRAGFEAGEGSVLRIIHVLANR
ncbi:hypothetical protein BXY53_0028 [Dichotomicrobium thermohalophilum]|uniref:Uncharacterized protein n=1 Tax=Dichotomicrobium thermohalophilum TaxID=933063 RepID=A0A397Q1P9_9HYPH|nr:hypothetical protein BXY53_0028 [Dichotomicrobium thermohalophilum]